MIERGPGPVRNEPGRAEYRAWVGLRNLGKRMRRSMKRAAWVLILTAAGLAAYLYVSTPPAVEVAAAKTITTSETLGAAGKVQGQRAANLGLDSGGVVQWILVREGDRVRQGQLLLSLSKSTLDARVRAASDAVRSAEAELAKASRGPLAAEVARARAEISQARLVGDARVSQAQAKLNAVKAGPRPQELREAQVELQRRKKALAKVQSDYKRTKELVDQGALSEQSLDQAAMDVEAAQADVGTQQERLSLIKAGARPEEVMEAQAAVAEARASRDTSIRAAEAGLNVLLSDPRPEDVRAARARVSEARAELQRTMGERANTDLRAPFSGIVASIPVEQGQSITPGQTAMVLHEMSRPIIAMETGEENLKVLSIGQVAIVGSDAYPGKTFNAVLYDLGSKVDADRGTIEVKLRPVSSVGWLRPDMTVDVNVVTKRNVRSIVVPTGALTKVQGHSSVFVVRDGRAVPVYVTAGGTGPSGVAVAGDLHDGDLVIRDGSSVTPNGRVRIVEGRPS